MPSRSPGDEVTAVSASRGSLRVVVDGEVCCGAGNCVLIAPGVFDQDSNTGVVVLLDSQPARGMESVLRQSAELCPVAAISLVRS